MGFDLGIPEIFDLGIPEILDLGIPEILDLGIFAHFFLVVVSAHFVPIPPFPILLDLIRMILTMTNLTFNDKHYLQIHGTAMGTRMAPSYANLLLAKFETDALLRAPFQPYIYGGVS